MGKSEVSLLLQEGKAFHQSKDLVKAAEKYEEAARLTENLNRKVALFTSSGNCLRDAKKYEDAVALSREALNLVSESDENNVTAVTILFAKTSLAKGLNQLGISEYKQGNVESAYQFFTEAADLTVNPKLKSACLVNAGQAYMKLGYFESAIENYDKAMQLEYENPKLPKLKSEALAGLADKCVSEEEFDAAKAHLHDAIKLVGDEILAKQYRAILKTIQHALGETDYGDGTISIIDVVSDSGEESIEVNVVGEVEEAG